MFNKNAANIKRERSGDNEGSEELTADILSSVVTGPAGNIGSIKNFNKTQTLGFGVKGTNNEQSLMNLADTNNNS